MLHLFCNVRISSSSEFSACRIYQCWCWVVMTILIFTLGSTLRSFQILKSMTLRQRKGDPPVVTVPMQRGGVGGEGDIARPFGFGPSSTPQLHAPDYPRNGWTGAPEFRFPDANPYDARQGVHYQSLRLPLQRLELTQVALPVTYSSSMVTSIDMMDQ